MSGGAGVEYYCPCGDVVEREHFLNGECSLPPAAFLAWEQGQASDVRHKAIQVTTTGLLSCPRKAALSRLGAAPVKVGGFVPLSVGTAVHDRLAGVGRVPGLHTEACSCHGPEVVDFHPSGRVLIDGVWHDRACGKAMCTFDGSIDGVHVTGRADYLVEVDEGEYIIGDYKVRNPNAKRFRKADAEAEKTSDDQLQLSINAELARQKGLVVHAGEIRTCYFYDWEIDRYPILPIDFVMECKPARGEATVRQIFDEAAKARLCVSVDEVLQTVRPLGQSMLPDRKTGRGTMCKQWCPYTYVCYPDELDA